jgi:hypothetical protein
MADNSSSTLLQLVNALRITITTIVPVTCLRMAFITL